MAPTTFRANRAGFSLVEMLVVVGAICFLLALLVPFVGNAREDARRSECMGKLKQIGLALHNYHDVFKTFPASAIYGDGQSGIEPQPARHSTWLFAILPYIESKPHYDGVDQDLPIWGQPIVGLPYSAYRCPSDSDNHGPEQTHGITITNYSASEGYHWWPKAEIEDRSPWNTMSALQTGQGSFDAAGVFAPEHYTNFDDIVDGIAVTIMVAENTLRGHKNGGLHTSGTGLRRKDDKESVFRSAFVFTAVQGQIGGNRKKYSRVDGSGPANNTWFRRQPYAFSPTYISAYGINTEWPGADSSHPGLANCLLADASIRGINEKIDWPVWLLMNAKSDGRETHEQ